MRIRNRRRSFIADINLSPLLDLTLMLVIFLAVTTEFISGGEIKIQVPKGGTAVSSSEESVKISMDKWGRMYYQGKIFEDPLEVAKQVPKGKRVFIKADREVPYYLIFNLLDSLRKAGVRKVSLVGQRVE